MLLVASPNTTHTVPNVIGADVWAAWYAGRGQKVKVSGVPTLEEALAPHLPKVQPLVLDLETSVDETLDRYATFTGADVLRALNDEEIAERERIAHEIATEREALDAQADEDKEFWSDLVLGLNDCGVRDLRILAKGRFNSKSMGKAEVVANLVQVVLDNPTTVNDILAAAGLPLFEG